MPTAKHCNDSIMLWECVLLAGMGNVVQSSRGQDGWFNAGQFQKKTCSLQETILGLGQKFSFHQVKGFNSATPGIYVNTVFTSLGHFHSWSFPDLSPPNWELSSCYKNINVFVCCSFFTRLKLSGPNQFQHCSKRAPLRHGVFSLERKDTSVLHKALTLTTLNTFRMNLNTDYTPDLGTFLTSVLQLNDHKFSQLRSKTQRKTGAHYNRKRVNKCGMFIKHI